MTYSFELPINQHPAESYIIDQGQQMTIERVALDLELVPSSNAFIE